MSTASANGTTSAMNASPCAQGRTHSPASSVAPTPASRPNIALTRHAATFSSAASRAISRALKLLQALSMQVLKTPLVLVLGHDACGAVDATIKSIKDGTALPGHLPTLVAAISPAVKAVQGEPGDMLENAIRRNVMLNVEKLRAAGPILNALVEDQKLRVVGGIYKLASGKVELLA